MEVMLRRSWHVITTSPLLITLLIAGCGGGGSSSLSSDNPYDPCLNNPSPAPILAPVTAIAAAARISFAIRDDKTLWAWGTSTKGQLGAPAKTYLLNPTKIGEDFTAISAGFGHSLALKSNGTLWAWGDNSLGQLGNNSSSILSDVPIQIGSDTYKAISAGLNFSLAIKSDGTLWAWGDDSFGQLGIGDNIPSKCQTLSSTNTVYCPVPVQVGSDNTYTAISAGTAHALALKSDNSLWAWGDNTYGELGDGCYIDTTQQPPVTKCAIRNDTTINSNVPEQIDSTSQYGAIAAGYFYSLAIKSDGTLWAWGNNAQSDLGTGESKGVYLVPTKIGDGYSLDPKALSASKFSVLGNSTIYYHSLALKNDGSLWAWGDNIFGQVGDGTMTPSPTPKQILAKSGFMFTAVSAGDDDHSLAIKNDGSLWAWGRNSCGALGNGNTETSYVPIQVSQ